MASRKKRSKKQQEWLNVLSRPVGEEAHYVESQIRQAEREFRGRDPRKNRRR